MRRTRLPFPGPRGAPVLGSLVPFARDPLDFLTRMRDNHGDAVVFRVVEHTVLFLSHPDHIEEALQTHWRSMHKDAIYALMKPLLGEGLVTSEGDTWRRHRQIVGPVFSRKHLEKYAATMSQRAAEWADSVPDGAEVDLHAGMMEITQHIVLDTLFGAQGELPVNLADVGDHLEVVMESFAHEAQGPGRLLPRSIPTPRRRRAMRSIKAIDELVYTLITARRDGERGDDLLSRLLEARDEDGNGLDDQALRDEALTMFAAGHETTALALTYTLLLLADHPNALDRLRAEVTRVCGSDLPGIQHVGDLTWCDAVVRESMRLLPPAWIIGRETQEEVEIAGQKIPPKVQIIVAQWTLHRDGRWFRDPEAFRPDRWVDGSLEDLPKMAYIPFGGGPRTCIGNRFAMMEAVLVLATLSQKVRFRPYGRCPPPLLPSITLRPIGPVLARASRA